MITFLVRCHSIYLYKERCFGTHSNVWIESKKECTWQSVFCSLIFYLLESIVMICFLNNRKWIQLITWCSKNDKWSYKGFGMQENFGPFSSSTRGNRVVNGPLSHSSRLFARTAHSAVLCCILLALLNYLIRLFHWLAPLACSIGSLHLSVCLDGKNSLISVQIVNAIHINDRICFHR